MSSPEEIATSFILNSPPGELHDVVNDIQTLTSDSDPGLVAKLRPAFERYNEEQFVAVALPGNTRKVLISPHNRLPNSNGRYFDPESKTSFEFDHITQKASSPTPYTPSSSSPSISTDLTSSLASHAADHYPSPGGTYAVYPSSSSSSQGQDQAGDLVMLLVSNKYSPANFWTGRWRAEYTLQSPASGSGKGKLTGQIQVDVHYYEDGNVRLQTKKHVDVEVDGSSGKAVVRAIAAAEKAYQTELGRAFVGLNEDGFKRLRRMLPVSRQKVEWEKVGGYRLGRDLRGGS